MPEVQRGLRKGLIQHRAYEATSSSRVIWEWQDLREAGLIVLLVIFLFLEFGSTSFGRYNPRRVWVWRGSGGTRYSINLLTLLAWYCHWAGGAYAIVVSKTFTVI